MYIIYTKQFLCILCSIYRQMQVQKILNENPEMQRDFLQPEQGKSL